MSKGGTLTVTATSARGNKTTDRYSLNGFGQALEQARRDCP
jgi:invasion protein IalB